MSIDYPRGSEWRKWDLHIHSPLSILNNQFPKLPNGEPNWKPYIEKLSLIDSVVLGITDYFTIEGFKVVKQYHEKGKLPNIKTILPNIEFRLKNIVSRKNGSEKRLDFHVIFSDDLSPDDIEEHFLHDTHFFYEGDPQNPDEKRKLKISNLEALGKKLIEQHQHFQTSGLAPLEVGAMQAVVDHEEITDILTSDSRFKGKYIVVLAAEEWDQINWNSQAHHLRKLLLQKSDMLFTSNSKTRNWCLGKDPYMEGIDHFLEEFKTLKPCIHGSDAHDIDTIGNPCARRGDASHNCVTNPGDCDNRYCWIKADPTFEGFKQIIYEPSERVRIQANNPLPIISNYSIDKISIQGSRISDELIIPDLDIDINSNLIAIVGGKGAGKTAFVDLIANCYIDRISAEDENSFVKRISDHNPGITTNLAFRSGIEFSKDINENIFADDSQIVYVAQGELERYIGEKSDLHQRISELIFESPNIKNSVLSYEYFESIAVIDQIEKQIDYLNKNIESLILETSDNNLNKITRDISRIQADIDDVDKRIKEVEKTQKKSHTEAAKKSQEKLGVLKERHENLTSVKTNLENAISIVDNDVWRFNNLISQINSNLTKLDLGEKSISSISYPDKDRLEKLTTKIQTNIKKTISEIEQEQREIDKLEFDVKRHSRLLESKRELERELVSSTEERKLFDENKNRFQELVTQRKSKYRELITSIIMQQNKYKDIINAFSKDKADILSDIDFIAEIDFDHKHFLLFADQIFDKRKITVLDPFLGQTPFDNLIKLASDLSNEEFEMDNLIEEIEKINSEHSDKLKGKPITIGDVYKLLYGNNYKVIPVVTYKNTSLSKLSLGQKATVLIKIYLAHGDKPIIIDSHDDHLDNEYIMEELVKSIRKAKNLRQVILVSNNGNVVINSDAEQIILASKKDDEISYISGSLEEPNILEQTLRVLEGGTEAFRKRQQKYRLGY